MPLCVTVPITTEVIEGNPDCALRGDCADGRIVVTVDTHPQCHHRHLGLGTKTPLHWTEEYEYEAQELSGLGWPIVYRVRARQGYYLDAQGQRVHFTTRPYGIDSHRQVSEVVMRAAVLLLIVGGAGFRKTSWLLQQLFQVEVSKSALERWVHEVAAQLPDKDEIIRRLQAQEAIHEAHFDEWYPKGLRRCVLVLRDEHGRIVTTQAVEGKEEELVKPLLQRLKGLGLPLERFYIDGCQAYYNAIRAVFGTAVQIQYDYFHIIQNAWRHLWKWAVAHRRQLKERSQTATTPWYKAQLKALAQSLWEHRHLLFKADDHLTAEERETLTAIVAADQQVGRLRAFLGGVWHIFEDCEDELEARQALTELKRLPVDPRHPEAFAKVVAFLEKHFEWMTAFLRDKQVKRNSLAETGMRTLRRLEVDHDGFRSEQGLDNMVRIYQAIKYLGWNVYHPSPASLKPP
jgi:hypothetical protein